MMEINDFQDKLLEDSKIRTEMSIKRTRYSKIRTALAVSAFLISVFSLYMVWVIK